MRVHQYWVNQVHVVGCESVAKDEMPFPPNGNGDAGLVHPVLTLQHLPLLHL